MPLNFWQDVISHKENVGWKTLVVLCGERTKQTWHASHAKSCTTALRRRKIHGLTCRTWVHDPLKLLLALRGRLRTFPSARTQKQHRVQIRGAPRGRRKKRAPCPSPRSPVPEGDAPPSKIRNAYFRVREIYRVSNTSLNFLAVKQKSHRKRDERSVGGYESECECGKAESIFVGVFE